MGAEHDVGRLDLLDLADGDLHGNGLLKPIGPDANEHGTGSRSS